MLSLKPECLELNFHQPLAAEICDCDVLPHISDFITIFNNVISTLTFLCYKNPAFRLGPVYRGQFGEVLSFLRPTVHTVFSNAPTFRGQSRPSGFGCVLDHSATTFGACAHLMKTAVRYQLRAQGRSPLSRTQHVWWDHREKSRRASTLWDCRGKSHLAGLSPANGTQSERGEKWKHVIVVAVYTYQQNGCDM